MAMALSLRSQASGTLAVVPVPRAVFATDAATGAYYDQRAAEYDEWYTGQGRFAERDRPGWEAELDQVVNLVRGLAVARSLDVACGTGFLTRHLHGFVVGLDQSPSMVAIAQSRLPDGLAIVGNGLRLMVADHAFDRVLTGHFYGHLPAGERTTFLDEARRVAGELIVIDSARRPGQAAEQWQERIPRRFHPYRAFELPPSVRNLIGPNPRVLADDVWATLLWTGLKLNIDDVSEAVWGKGRDRSGLFYPLELVRALAVVWLFSGLRSAEIRRLRVGAISRQRAAVRLAGSERQIHGSSHSSPRQWPNERALHLEQESLWWVPASRLRRVSGGRLRSGIPPECAPGLVMLAACLSGRLRELWHRENQRRSRSSSSGRLASVVFR
jgi:ubiquinone/menaquinone biosynthesis C-methylase UbiE